MPENPTILYEGKTEAHITSADIDAFGSFVNRGTDRLEVTPFTSPTFEPRSIDLLSHGYAYAEIKDRLRLQMEMDLVFAKSGVNLVGYSLVCLDRATKKADATFLGVAEDYHRRGIGSTLLQIRHQRLHQVGVTSYTTNARGRVLQMYDKLGISYQINPPYENIISLGTPVTVSV